MKGRRPIVLTTLVTLAAFAFVACSDVEGSPLIFAAASLVDVMGEIQAEYEKESGQSVRFNFGGSNLLANQISTGAQANAVIVAGQTPFEKLIDRGKVKEGDVVGVFANRMVIVNPSGAKSSITNLSDLVGAGRIAMPDPTTAPAGEYFEAVLRERGDWDNLRDQIIPTLDVRAALAAVMTRNVAYAFVYQTDAMTTTEVEIALSIESYSEATTPRYYASRISGDSSADRFLGFLTSMKAAAILESYGFSR